MNDRDYIMLARIEGKLDKLVEQSAADHQRIKVLESFRRVAIRVVVTALLIPTLAGAVHYTGFNPNVLTEIRK